MYFILISFSLFSELGNAIGMYHCLQKSPRLLTLWWGADIEVKVI